MSSREDRDRAAAQRQRLVERLKARAKPSPASAAPQVEAPRPRRMHALDVGAALAAAQRLKFMRLDPSLDIQVGAPDRLNRPTLALLSAFLMSLQTGSSRGILQWPFGQRDASVLHPLAMLAMLCAPSRAFTPATAGALRSQIFEPSTFRGAAAQPARCNDRLSSIAPSS